MKHSLKFVYLVFLSALLLAWLAACGGSRVKFVAPEIDPPADLIPAYVPEGFELIKGYQIEVGEFEEQRSAFIADDGSDGRRLICDLDLSGSFFNLESPAGNEILGVHYQDGDHLLLITKSYYPGGSLELWRASFEGQNDSDQDCECDCRCCCVQAAVIIDQLPFPLSHGEIHEVRTIVGTQVAILDHGSLDTTVVFVRGDYLLTVQGNLTLEENLKVVASLLGD